MATRQCIPQTDPCASIGNCPFYDHAHGNCRAALLAFDPNMAHCLRYCLSDDHDDCTVFLAKALRSSASGGQARDAAAYCEK